MKRLHSYLTYPFILMFLFFDAWVTYTLLDKYDVNLKLLVALVSINAVFIMGFVMGCITLKRVYLDGSTVYIYDLHSRIPYAIELQEIVRFERDNSRYSVLWGIYKITIAVEDQEQTFEFMKNKMILNVRQYFEETE